jgi:hypothetical protein
MHLPGAPVRDAQREFWRTKGAYLRERLVYANHCSSADRNRLGILSRGDDRFVNQLWDSQLMQDDISATLIQNPTGSSFDVRVVRGTGTRIRW